MRHHGTQLLKISQRRHTTGRHHPTSSLSQYLIQQLRTGTRKRTVLTHIRDDIAAHTRALQPRQRLRQVRARPVGTASHRHPAPLRVIAGIETKSQKIRIGVTSQGTFKPGRIRQSRAGHVHAVRVQAQGTLQALSITHAATNLNTNRGRALGTLGTDGGNHLSQNLSIRAATKCQIKVNQVNPASTRLHPGQSRLNRVEALFTTGQGAAHRAHRVAFRNINSGQKFKNGCRH